MLKDADVEGWISITGLNSAEVHEVAHVIGGLIPCSVLPDEILADHPNKFRGALVVIDVAFTETEPLGDSLPEPEIHRRLCRALGAHTDDDLVELKAAVLRGRSDFSDALLTTLADRPHLGSYLPLVLMETLGPTLGEGNEAAAAVWG